MDWILNWIGQNQVIAWIGSIILSVGAVWKLLEKHSPKIRRAIKIVAEASELIDSILVATEDKVITKDEVEKIAQKVQELQTALK